MEKIKCPHCGSSNGEVEHNNGTKYFICSECSSMFRTIEEDGKIKVEFEA